MKSIFNEYGVPAETVTEVAHDLERIAREFFRQMMDEGYPISEIRGVGEYFGAALGCAVSEAVLTAAFAKKKAQHKDADSNLSDEEMVFAANGMRIEAIRAYKTRTNFGLKESMDAVENWIRNYNENNENQP